MIGASRQNAAILLTLLAGLCPAVAHAQFGGFGPGNRVGLGGFGALPGLPGNFNIVNGLGPTGNTRVWQSQEPLLNVFDGQTSLMQIQSFQWAPVNVQVVQSGGALAFVPQYQPLPFGQSWPIQAVQTPYGIQRMSVAPTISNSGLGPAFPITTFINPVFAGGAMGPAAPFTQIINQPGGFNTVAANTTVGVPIGGNALIGNFQNQMGNRNQFGVPLFGGFPGMAPFFNNLQLGGNGNFIPLMAPRIP
jgi:hypothetical protein